MLVGGERRGKKRKSKETNENENGRKGEERKRFIDLARKRTAGQESLDVLDPILAIHLRSSFLPFLFSSSVFFTPNTRTEWVSSSHEPIIWLVGARKPKSQPAEPWRRKEREKKQTKGKKPVSYVHESRVLASRAWVCWFLM